MSADKAARALADVILALHRVNFDIGEVAIECVEVDDESRPALEYRWENLLDDLIPKDPAEPRFYLRAAIIAYEDALVNEQLAAMAPPPAKRPRPRARRAA